MRPEDSFQDKSLDSRQIALYKKILVLGIGPAQFYRDACHILKTIPPFESSTHLIAHLLRELDSAIRGILYSIVDEKNKTDEVKNIESKRTEIITQLEALGFEQGTPLFKDLLKRHEGSRKGQILSILKELDVKEDHIVAQEWLDPGLHRFAHRSSLDSSRPLNSDFLSLWQKMEDVFLFILNEFENHYLKTHDILDRFASKDLPTNNDIKLLKNGIPNNSYTLGYFFDNLQSPKWLKPLWKEDFFCSIPEPVYTEQKTFYFPRWAPAQYLIRMASVDPETVSEILSSVPPTDNALAHLNILQASFLLPPSKAAKVAQSELKWLEQQRNLYLLLPNELGKLIEHLASGKEIDLAIILAKILFQLLPPEKEDITQEPRARMSNWDYAERIKNTLPSLAEADGIRSFTLLCDLLDKGVEYSLREKETPNDYSFIWCPAIGDHKQNSVRSESLNNILVVAIREAGQQLIDLKPYVTHELLALLCKYRWPVFSRIGYFLLQNNAQAYPSLVAEYLVQEELIRQQMAPYEFLLLLQNGFGIISSEQQELILSWIKEGPNFSLGKERGQEEIEMWKRDRLYFISEHLMTEWKDEYESLVKKYAEPSHPGIYYRRNGAIWVGPRSPMSADALKSITVDDLIHYLKTWEPTGDSFAASPEGLGRELQSIVALAPEKYVAAVYKFQGLEPTYVNAILRGLKDAVGQNRSFEWGQVLKLCQWVINQPKSVAEPTQDWDRDPHWGWTRQTIAYLLIEGFKSKSNKLPMQLREKLWSIIEPLSIDPNPTAEDEAKYGNKDYLHIAINSIRGVAMEAVIRYALWISERLDETQGSMGILTRNFADMPEVQNVLDYHLTIENDQSLAIRSVYGYWLQWIALLDPAWTKANIERIFPRDTVLGAYRQEAWQTFVNFCQPYQNVFDMIKDEYIYEVLALDNTKTDGHYPRFTEHLMMLYWHGVINFDDENTLLAIFYRHADAKLCAHALNFIGRSLMQDKKPSPEVLNRLKHLWEWRLTSATSVELSEFGLWFASKVFDTKWSLDQLLEALRKSKSVEMDHMVVEVLDEMAEVHAEKVIECLRLLVEGDSEGWGILSWKSLLRNILLKTITISSSRDAAMALINYLGYRGYPEYRDILPD